VALPADYVDHMYESRCARHFYTDDERQRFREQWLGRDVAGTTG
jgi:hypothetical protein